MICVVFCRRRAISTGTCSSPSYVRVRGFRVSCFFFFCEIRHVRASKHVVNRRRRMSDDLLRLLSAPRVRSRRLNYEKRLGTFRNAQRTSNYFTTMDAKRPSTGRRRTRPTNEPIHLLCKRLARFSVVYESRVEELYEYVLTKKKKKTKVSVSSRPIDWRQLEQVRMDELRNFSTNDASYIKYSRSP